MLSSFAVIILLVLASIIFLLFIFDKKRKEAIHQQKVSLSEEINSIKQRYKLDVERLCEHLDLLPIIKNKLYMVANNYFVFQSISDEKVEHLRTMLNKLSQSYNHLIELHDENDNADTINEKILSFSDSLPLDAKGFNVVFYEVTINELDKLLEFDIAIDESADEHITEEKINEVADDEDVLSVS